MNTIPNLSWIAEWKYEVLKDNDGGEIIGGAFFTFQKVALWRVINQLGVLYSDINTTDYNNKIMDRVIDGLWHGDWITQIVAISNIERINCFDPDFTAYIRWISSDDCGYDSWIVGREEYWTETGFEAVKRYAKFVEWRLDNYGDEPNIGEPAGNKTLFFTADEPSYKFDKPFNIDDYRTGYDKIITKFKQAAAAPPIPPPVSSPKPSSLPSPVIPPPITIKAAIPVVTSKQPAPPVKKKVPKKDSKKVQQQLF